jgi:hypothetical protein
MCCPGACVFLRGFTFHSEETSGALELHTSKGLVGKEFHLLWSNDQLHAEQK